MKTHQFNHWQVAWRCKSDNIFHLIPNPAWGWCADPFLVKYRDEIYLFSEIFLYKSERNGVIGYCQYKGDGFSEWKVSMDRHWHLSYPNVWEENGRLYMCPESYQMEEVAIYELIDFPDKWRKVKSIVANVEYCDSSFWRQDGITYMFTFERNEEKGLLCRLDDAGGCDTIYTDYNKEKNRCGGKIYLENGKIIRVAQDCKNEYGKGLLFLEIENIGAKYREREIKRWYPEDIMTDSTKHFTGIHTYNRIEDIEVIDLKYKVRSWTESSARKRVRRVFLDKYAGGRRGWMR